jgi:hypothetical protein
MSGEGDDMAGLEGPPQASPSPGPDGPGLRQVVGRRSIVLLTAGTVLTFLAIFSLWGWRTFASSQGFADVATDMLHDPYVREVVSEQIVTALESQELTESYAVGMRPLMREAVAFVVGTEPFQGVFHSAARQLHAQLARGVQTSLLMRVPDAAQMVQTALEETQPTLTSVVPESAIPVLVGISQNTPIDTLVRTASLAGWLAGPFALAAFVCFAAAITRASDRRRAVEAVGWCLIGLGLFLWALLHVLGSIASRSGDTPLEGNALRAVFWSATNLISIQTAIVVTIGAVMVVAGAYAGTANLRTRGHLLWHGLWERLERPGWKALASVALITVAVVAMVWPAGTAAVIVRILAFMAFVAGAVGLLDLAGSRRWTTATVGPVKVSTHRLAVGSVAVAMATCALLFFGGLAFVRAVRAPTAKHQSIAETGCNGSLALCDKRLDEVVFAGTHNSMAASAEDGNWFGPNQTGGLLAQLSAGVRALAMDLHYGNRFEGGVVRTDIARSPEATYELNPLEQAFVDRVMQMAGTASDESKPYLCHNTCELGALDAVEGFGRIHDWLRENPNQVVLIILQDEIEAADAVKALERSRLASRAYTWEPDTPFPTLRQMIEAKRNVLIMAERGGGEAPWYHAAYGAGGLLQETPYDFESPAEFSCQPGRSGTTGRLFLLNHWISPPSSQMAEQVNDEDVLLSRAKDCHEERGKLTNVILVDFFNRGDLVEVVRTLNGVSPRSSPFQAAPDEPS